MDTSNIGRYVVSAIVAIVLALVSFRLFPIVQQNADEYLMVFIDHCAIGESQNYVKSFLTDTDGEIITRAVNLNVSNNAATATAPTCAGFAATQVFTLLETPATAYADGTVLTVVDEHGEELGTATGSSSETTWTSTAVNTTGGKVEKPLEVTRFLSDLSQLIVRIIPILSVVSFLALTASSLFSYSLGASTGDVTRMIGIAIGGLIGIVVVLNLAPTLFDGLNDAYLWTSTDRLTIMEQFGEIVRVIVRFVPVIFTASILTVVGAANWMAYRQARG